MRSYLKDNGISIKNGTDVNSVMRDMMSALLEGALDEELGYSRYDYWNKDTDNSRNGYSKKTMCTSYGNMEMAVPRDRNGEYEPQLIKKYQNAVTQNMEDKILPIVREWQEHPLEEVYAVVFMDVIHYHVRIERRIVKCAVYIALGIDMNGKKDVLGMYVGENESAKFWLSSMNGLKNRGVEISRSPA